MKRAYIPNQPLLDRAFAIAGEILNSRDGAGFIFRAYTAGGLFEGPPPSDAPLHAPENGILEIEMGDSIVLIRSCDLVALAVVEV